MDEFWKGFEKKAKASTEDLEPVEDLNNMVSEKEKKKNVKVDPLTESLSFTPDTYWKSWP